MALCSPLGQHKQKHYANGLLLRRKSHILRKLAATSQQSAEQGLRAGGCAFSRLLRRCNINQDWMGPSKWVRGTAPLMELLDVLVEAVPAFHKSSANTADCPLPGFQRPIFKSKSVFIHLILLSWLPGFSFHAWIFHLQRERSQNAVA